MHDTTLIARGGERLELTRWRSIDLQRGRRADRLSAGTAFEFECKALMRRQ
jgi:hypothetical protein